MIKHLTRHGNSYALIIDRAILELLKIRADSPLELSTDGTVLIVQRAPDTHEKPRTQKAPKHTTRRAGGKDKNCPGQRAARLTSSSVQRVSSCFSSLTRQVTPAGFVPGLV